MDCLFCKKDFYSDDKKIFETDNWIAIYDGYPVNLGHTLIIPKNHIYSLFDIDDEGILIELFHVIKEVKTILSEKYNPDAFNVGINDGESAGQTIPHLHIHLIPRYKNDGGLPCGVRNIFKKEIANYVKERS